MGAPTVADVKPDRAPATTDSGVDGHGWLTNAAALAVAAVVATVVTAALHRPLLDELTTARAGTAFHDGHIWAFDHISRMLLGDRPLSQLTDAIGYPATVRAPAIAWLPALAAAPLNPLLGPLGAYNLVVLLSPAVAVLAMAGMLRHLTRCHPWIAAAGGLAFALCPYALGCLASGQTAKFQHWLVPLYLWMLSAGIRGPRWPLALAAAGIVALATGFTSPSTAVLLPLLAFPWAVIVALKAPRPRLPSLLRALAVLAVTAACLLPAQRYYGNLRHGIHPSAFEPGIANWDRLSTPAPVAQPEGVSLGRGGLAWDVHQTSHVTYLGLPLLAAMILLSLRRFRGRGLAWTAVGVGVIVAIGPYLISGGAFVEVGGNRLALPARLLEVVGYPLARTGTYYRAVLLASVGLSLALAGGLSTRRAGWMILAAWAVALLQVGDGWRVTRSLWPRPAEPIEGRLALEQMRDDPVAGAVFDLPLEAGTYEGGVAMLASVVHRRPTTALPRQSKRYLPRVDALARNLETALAAGSVEGRGQLADLGFRYVVLRPWLTDEGTRERLVTGLGSPDLDGDILVWTLDPPPE